MRLRIRVIDAALVVALTAAAVAMARSYYRSPAPGASDPDSAPGASHWGANYFPNVKLTTHEGKIVRFYDDLLKGKSVLVNPMFTACPDVCPLQTATLVQVKKILGERVGRDIFFYSISIDPEHDTPAVLKAYAEKFGAGGPGWLFLTGDPEDIELVTEKLGTIRARQDPLSRDSHHEAIAMIGNEPTGQWTRHSAVDSPPFFAARIGTFLGWRDSRPQRSYAEARPLTIDNGRRLFLSKCSACHTIGQGVKLGPDLKGVTARRERAWLTRYIQSPDELLAQGDPIATALFEQYKKVRMPNLLMGSSDVADIVSYLESRSDRARGAAEVKNR